MASYLIIHRDKFTFTDLILSVLYNISCYEDILFCLSYVQSRLQCLLYSTCNTPKKPNQTDGGKVGSSVWFITPKILLTLEHSRSTQQCLSIFNLFVRPMFWIVSVNSINIKLTIHFHYFHT